MKKKKLAKIINEALKNHKYDYAMKPVEEFFGIDTTEEMSDKVFNFILKLSKKDETKINIYSSTRITIQSSLKNSEVIEISLIKDVGYTIFRHQPSTYYASSNGSPMNPHQFSGEVKCKDPKMFDKLCEQLNSIRFQKENEFLKNNIDDLIMSCGIIREDNLDKLLDEEN